MEIVKPEPLVMDGRAYYTLTSYGPVSIEVDVQQPTEADVDQALRIAITHEGGGPERLNDDAWIRDHFEGIHSVAELRDTLRTEVHAFYEQMTEQQKTAKCGEALAARLVQRVPQSAIAATREQTVRSFAYAMAQSGMDERTFLAQSGMTTTDLERMFDEKARALAEEEAALDAFARERKLQVSDAEIPQLLGASPADVGRLMDELHQTGQLEEARTMALHAKAMGLVVSECECTYHHEPSKEDEQNSRPRFKLV